MAQNARPTMASPARLAKILWLWASVWACWVPGGLGAAAIPSDLTTESYIYTGPTKGPPKPPEPPKDFEINWETPYASSVKFIISFNATFNVSKVVLRYKDPQDSSGHQVTLNVNANGGFDPTLMFAQGSGRLGFKYKMGGLSRLRRYVIRVDAYLDDMSPMANSTISFLTGENDGESQLYNLTGIILVLGISTIIMVVVMVCVGYEKLIQQKKEDCCDFLCCRREKRKGPKVSISPEPLMVQDRRDMDDDSPTSSHRY